MHPALAHDLVEQRMRQRLDDAEARRLGRSGRDRRNGRRTSARAADEPKLRRLTLVAPQPTC